MRGMNNKKDLNKFKELCSKRVGLIQCINSLLDSSGVGPPLDSLEFKIDLGDDKDHTLLYLTGFYGSSFTLDPGARFKKVDHSALTKEELDYVSECHDAAGLFT